MMTYSEIFEQLELQLSEETEKQAALPFVPQLVDHPEDQKQWLENCRKAFLTVAVTAVASVIPPVFAFTMMW